MKEIKIDSVAGSAPKTSIEITCENPLYSKPETLVYNGVQFKLVPIEDAKVKDDIQYIKAEDLQVGDVFSETVLMDPREVLARKDGFLCWWNHQLKQMLAGTISQMNKQPLRLLERKPEGVKVEDQSVAEAEIPVYKQLQPGDRFTNSLGEDCVYLGRLNNKHAYWFFGNGEQRVGSIEESSELILKWHSRILAEVKPNHQRVTFGCEIYNPTDDVTRWVRSIHGDLDCVDICNNCSLLGGVKTIDFADLDKNWQIVEQSND
jgi:hypothetical protein